MAKTHELPVFDSSDRKSKRWVLSDKEKAAVQERNQVLHFIGEKPEARKEVFGMSVEMHDDDKYFILLYVWDEKKFKALLKLDEIFDRIFFKFIEVKRNDEWPARPKSPPPSPPPDRSPPRTDQRLPGSPKKKKLIGGLKLQQADDPCFGTIGLVFKRNGTNYLVSSRALFPDENEQPLYCEPLFPSTIVAKTKNTSNHWPLVAVGKVQNGVDSECNKIEVIGQINGIATACPNEKVVKYGAKTNLTNGTVHSLLFTRMVDDDNYFFYSELDLILIEGSFADDGDSGSLVVNENNDIIGMIMGGITGKYTWVLSARHFEDLLDEKAPVNLKIDLSQGYKREYSDF